MLLLDLSFVRAANLGRMDMLTLLWMLLALALATRGNLLRSGKLPETQVEAETIAKPIQSEHLWRLDLLCGIATGLAAMSHPIAIVLVPFLLILVLPGLRRLLWIAAGAGMALIPWLVYILRYPDIFLLQFSMQLGRKGDMVQFFDDGNPATTGGIFKVFLAQYGEGRILMLLALLWLLLSLGALAWHLWRSRKPVATAQQTLQWRWSAIGLLNLVLVMLASEGWYALYVSPQLAIAFALPCRRAEPPVQPDTGWSRAEVRRQGLPLLISVVLLALMTLIFHAREQAANPSRTAMLPVREAATIQATAGCQRIYLRAIPDPYFALRSTYPEMEVLEFIPGKLTLPEEFQDLTTRFDSIDCFLLNDAMSWEPQLDSYLKLHAPNFERTALEHDPLPRVTLWQRRILVPSGQE